MDRSILHSDCDSFYVSVELLSHPELAGKPVSVGGDEENRHGIILSSSPEAKKFGVRTGEALWQARQKCRDLVILRPSYEKYIKYSGETRSIYLDYTDMVEPFGLDEAWLDVTGSADLRGGGMLIAEDISKRVKKELGITVSIGVSFNKVFAKVGSDHKKPDGITEVSRENYENILFPLPVSDLLFVGRATERKLRSLGICTIGDLAAFPPDILRERFGKCGEILHYFANGLDTTPVGRYYDMPIVKSVGNSTTTPRDLINYEDVKIIILKLSDKVSCRLKEQRLSGRVISVGIRSASLSWVSRQIKLPYATNLSSEISAQALRLFRENYDWKEPVRSLGVCVSDLSGETPYLQLSVFDEDEKRNRREDLETAMFELKNRFGMDSVGPAVLLTDKELSGFGMDDHGTALNTLPPGVQHM